MNQPAGVRISADYPIPPQMKAWVLGGPDELFLHDLTGPGRMPDGSKTSSWFNATVGVPRYER